jgi:putative ABC transport system permease protein
VGSLLRRLLFFFRRDQFDRDLDEELRFHEEMKAQSLADDMSADEARAAARRRIGNPLRLREQAREPWTVPVLQTLAQDVRHALRLMGRDPAFTVTALATLALGIGLNTAIFSVAYGVLWRPLPFPDADRLIVILSARQTDEGIRSEPTWSAEAYEALRPRETTIAAFTSPSAGAAQLTGRGEPLQVRALTVSPNFFATLGVAPAYGRPFLTGAAAADDDRSAIVSHRLWRTALEGDPAIVGHTITIDGLPRTVVGVLPPDFSFRSGGAPPESDIFLPGHWVEGGRGNAFLNLLGRMKPGVTRERAQAEVTALMNEPAVASAAGETPLGGRTVARVIGLQEQETASVRRLLLILLGAVGFVLLIACVNVANLQMARLTARRGELSVRMAIGAGRQRIVRQLLTEAGVLSLLGAALGVLLARLAIGAALPLVPDGALLRTGGIVIDARVMAFCLGLSLLASVLVGLVPALRISGSAFGEGRALHAGETRATGDRQGERLRTLLVSAQVALTLVLLIGAGLLIHSFFRLTSVSPGFESSGEHGVVQTISVTLPQRVYDEPARIHAVAREVLDRIQYLTGVQSASLINMMPFGTIWLGGEFEIAGQPKPKVFVAKPKIGAAYFKTMGIRLLAGREFTPEDTAAAQKVAIVSERIVREYFPGGPAAALGRLVRLRGPGDSHPGDWLTVIGVVADIRQLGLDQEPDRSVYIPFQQERDGFFIQFISFVVRTSTPASVVEGVRAEIRRAAPDLPIESTVTMDEAVATSVAEPRFRMLLLALFAFAATLIATCGIYGLMAYAVTQRRREIGVRMALGAERRDVLRLVLARALRVVAAGVMLGLAGAFGVTRVLQRFLFGVTPTDPIAFTVVTLALMAVGLTAAWMPARRATRIDPVAALRAE